MEKVQPNMREHLAVAVRTLQWSYSIFWSISPYDPGVLEWGEGYYNGDIKTRKTVQAMEINVDEMGLQRSEQLRELYESLLASESDPQAKRPCDALSPEDLSDTEWYYLVCMSFVFNLGQGLPGRSLANGEPLWICNAHKVDSNVFSRSLLAKSASVQTVVCFPFLGGVVELGVNDSVQEDLPLIQYVQASLLGIDCDPVLLQRPSSVRIIDDNAPTATAQDDDLRLLVSFDNSSDSFGLIQTEKEATFMTSSDCITLDVVNSENPGGSCPAGIDETEDDDDDDDDDDVHYHNVLSSLLKSTRPLILGPSINFNKQSCFLSWKNGGSIAHKKYGNRTPQRMLKSILFEVPRMHTLSPISALKSLIPSINKVDKASILDDTITHLKVLEKRVKELETCLNSHDGSGGTTTKKDQDMTERTPYNYKSNIVGIKRKGCHDHKRNQEDNVFVSLIDKDILIDIRCQWKERLLLEFIDALSNYLLLDSHSVQASTSDGVLRVKINSKINEPMGLSAGMIRQVLLRAILKCGGKQPFDDGTS